MAKKDKDKEDSVREEAAPARNKDKGKARSGDPPGHVAPAAGLEQRGGRRFPRIGGPPKGGGSRGKPAGGGPESCGRPARPAQEAEQKGI